MIHIRRNKIRPGVDRAHCGAEMPAGGAAEVPTCVACRVAREFRAQARRLRPRPELARTRIDGGRVLLALVTTDGAHLGLLGVWADGAHVLTWKEYGPSEYRPTGDVFPGPISAMRALVGGVV